jgi:hypothetical protein
MINTVVSTLFNFVEDLQCIFDAFDWKETMKSFARLFEETSVGTSILNLFVYLIIDMATVNKYIVQVTRSSK